jgi:membrane peptidoglycan carboxypeptidase
MRIKRLIKKLIIIFILLFIFLLIYKPLNSFSLTKNQQIVILDQDNNPIIELVNNHKITPINLEELNPLFIDMLLAVEDDKFYSHSGFNIMRIAKSIIDNITKSKTSGGSTITQQYIKNTYLSNDKTISRKIKELYYAIKLEQLISKDEILTKYLNCIYFGNNIYGLANASTYYFNTHYSKLSINEMLTLISIINSPSYYSTNLDQLENRKIKLGNILLKKNKIKHSCVNLLGYPNLHKFMRDKYYPIVAPYLFVNSKFVGGFDEITALHNAGKIDSLIKDNNLTN